MSRARLHSAAALLLALAFLAQAGLGSVQKSLTWDESGYIAAGYANWVWGDYRLNADHPPLMQKLQGLPLLFMGVTAPPIDPRRHLESPNPRPAYGRDLVFRSGNDAQRIARWARAPVMGLGALLVWCVFAWGRRLFGSGPALLPAALVALCPNLVAHAKLATEDLGCALGFFASVWTLWRCLQAPGWGRAATCGVVTGLALLTKYTALLLVPIHGLLGAAALAAAPGPRKPLWVSLGGIAGLAFLVVGFGYGVRFRPDLYWDGIFRIYPDVAGSYAFTLLGHVSDEPLWYHALVSLGIKLPLATWLVLALAAGRAWRAQPALRDAFLLLPPALVVGASFFDIANPGIRRVLPAVPFLLLFGARTLEGAPGRLRRAALAGLLVWLAVEAALIFPHHLSYLNVAVGGPARGPWVTDESNIDWGQDLPALAAWQRAEQPDEPIYLLYFGTADPAAYGVRALPLERERLEDPGPGTYAISAHYLAWFRKLRALHGEGVDWLGRYEPVAKAGYSIFIYRIGERSAPPAARSPASSESAR